MVKNNINDNSYHIILFGPKLSVKNNSNFKFEFEFELLERNAYQFYFGFVNDGFRGIMRPNVDPINQFDVAKKRCDVCFVNHDASKHYTFKYDGTKYSKQGKTFDTGFSCFPKFYGFVAIVLAAYWCLYC